MSDTESSKVTKGGIFWRGFAGMRQYKTYPGWRYHKWLEPIIVNDTDEDYEASIAGWKKLDIPFTSVKHLNNWRYDLEDMTARQLVLFAYEEFGVDLPLEAGEEKLLKAIWKLTNFAPQNKGRITLMAQSIEMNYDETVKYIQGLGKDMEMNLSEVFYA